MRGPFIPSGATMSEQSSSRVQPTDGSVAAGVSFRSWLSDIPDWAAAALRILAVAFAVFVAWYVASHWNRWTGAARLQQTDDAFISGDITPLAAKVSGYVRTVAVEDFQTVKKGDLIVEIEPSDYDAALMQAEANVGGAKATLDNLANQKDVQRSLVRQAEAAIKATQADLVRFNLEVERQRHLLKSSEAGTPQSVERAVADADRTAAQLELNKAQLDQQKAILASLDVSQAQLESQLRASKAQEELAKNNVGYTRILSPADGLVGQRLVRPGQFVNIGTQVIAVVSLPEIWVIANYKETQMTNLRLGQTARITVDAFPDLKLSGRVEGWAPATGSTFALLPPDNATGNFTKVIQRLSVKIVLDPNPFLGTLVRPGMSVVATIDTGDSNGSASGAALVPAVEKK